MPTVRFKMRDLQGAPISNTWFRAEPGYPDSVVLGAPLPVVVDFYTDGAGEATVSLVAGKAPYYLNKQHAGAPDQVAYKLFVPESDKVLEANVLYVDLGMHMRFTNDASLLALIDAKVKVLAALDQIKLISSVILPGADGIQQIADSITALQVLLNTTIASVNTQIAALTASVNAVDVKASQAVTKADAAIANAAFSLATANSAKGVASQAHEVAVLADQHAQEGKLLGQNALAAINLLTARIVALGG